MSLAPPLDLASPLDASAEGLRLALTLDFGWYPVDSEVRTAVREAADALAAAGAVVDEVEVGWGRELPEAWVAHWGVYLAALFGDALREHRERMDPRVVALMDAGLAMGAVDFKRLEFVRTEAWKRLRPVLERYHALLCPTMAQPAPPIGSEDFIGLDLTCQFNLVSQCPALSVPAGFTAGGLPLGLQIVARRYRDDLALRIGAALERARPWAQRRPVL
jgi:Asp-tRNA(Asn)/Glu-tRNA(Gln) amidotransferase A subunit family amidase